MKILTKVIIAGWILFVIYLMIAFAVDPEGTGIAVVVVFSTIAFVWWLLYQVEQAISKWLK